MIQEYTFRLLPQDAIDEDRLKSSVCRLKGINPTDIKGVRLLKRSVDARQKTVYLQVQLQVFINEIPETSVRYTPIEYGDVTNAAPVIVVGAGPAGLFAALRLIELGRKPIVVERGKPVSERKRDIAQSVRTRHISPESNYCYGEGGAGAFSDGKLYTRSKKRGNVQRILQIFHQFGADDSVLTDAHPHIGTDRLPGIISHMREQILKSGGQVYFETRMTELLLKNNEVRGIRCQNGLELCGPVILATGHSARDVYQMLHGYGFPIEAKGFAMGVRLEHPQPLIDRLMYHSPKGRGDYLPAAEYSFVEQVEGRGVYSFCMCPGGFIVPAGERDGLMVVNGMSPSNRGSKWANSGMVVEIRPEDIGKYDKFIRKVMAQPTFEHTLPAAFDKMSDYQRMMLLQQAYEHHAWLQVRQGLVAPAQRMVDFLMGQLSSDLPSASYIPGIRSSPLHQWMPYELRNRLQKGFKLFDKRVKGFLTNEAQLIAAETRTSSPVRLPREADSLHLVGVEGLFPCGEGAGYAGGIVSSAIDGELCADSVCQGSRRENLYIQS